MSERQSTATIARQQARTAAETAFFGKATARKCGRNPRWPYCPVIDKGPGYGIRKQQIPGLAFQTRDEAIRAAEDHIAQEREFLFSRLLEPRMRALRSQHGLPREIT